MSKSITVKYHGLEILCYPETVLKYRQGQLAKNKVLMSDDAIYKDIKKGNVASAQDLAKVFGNDMTLENAMEVILQKGDFQMTTKERQMLQQNRRAQLLEYFNKHFLDPKTNTAHPISILDATFNQVKAKINYEIPLYKNAEEIRKSMLGILPIKPKDSFTPEQPPAPPAPKPKDSAEKTKYGRKKGGVSRHRK